MNNENYNNNINTNNTPFNYNSNYVNQNYTQNTQFQNNNGSSNKSKLKKVIFILLVIVILATIGLFLYLKKDKTKNNDFDINYSTAFFIQDSNSKYALFNDDGKKLTDFIFTHVSDFVNGTSLVKKDDAYGIIDSNGKMTVDFGKYDYITNAAGMYKVHDKDYHYYLINGSGKVLYDMENMSLDTFIGANTYSILEDDKSKTYKVLNYEGQAMLTFPINDNIEDSPSTNEEDGYISVFYNKKNYILNLITGKEMISFNSDVHYCVNNVEEDGKIITLNSCVSWYQSQEKTYYKFIKDGKLYDLNDKCEKVYYSEGNLVCYNNYKNYLLDSNLNVGIQISDTAYLDNNNYAKSKDGSFSGIDFYNNGKVVKKVECRRLEETGYMKNGLYILGTYYSKTCKTESGTYEYYTSNGENAFGKSFQKAEKFDENGLAKVSEDKENYYLIDSTGKKVSNDYSSISLSSGYYIVAKDDLKGIIDKDGKIIVDCLYLKVEITEKQNKKYAKLTTSDSKYVIYDISEKSELMTFDSSPSFSTHYITVKKDGHNQYYTYNGKMFYESK